MRGPIGCAGMIAAVGFALGIVGSLFATEASIGERLLRAALTGAITFVAALLLFARDYRRQSSTRRAVRQTLLARRGAQDDEFSVRFPAADPALIAQTRQAISQFFDVPAEKIHPTDNVHSDFHADIFEPGFHTFVVYRVLNALNVAPAPFTFSLANISDVADLANEIQRVLDGFGTADPRDGG